MRKAVESANEKMEHYRQLYNDCNRNKTNMEISLASQMEAVVKEKHASQARVAQLEDGVAALQVEKDVLLSELKELQYKQASSEKMTENGGNDCHSF